MKSQVYAHISDSRISDCVSTVAVDHLPKLYPCCSWMKTPQTPCARRGPRCRPRAKPGVGVAAWAVRGVCPCRVNRRPEGNPRRCIWTAPAAARAAGWPRCTPSGTRQRHCGTSSASAGPAGSSPSSASRALFSATRREKTI